MRDTRARLDVQRLEADAGVKRAAVAEREADAEKARRDVSRMEELNQRTSGAQSETEDKKTLLNIATARLDMARSELASADASLNWARERLARMSIAAPFAARVVEEVLAGIVPQNGILVDGQGRLGGAGGDQADHTHAGAEFPFLVLEPNPHGE